MPMSNSFSSLFLGRFKPYYLYRLLKWKFGSRAPLGVGLKVTNRCPMGCRHCAWYKPDDPELSTKVWMSLIDEARRRGCIFALFEGGEPTMRDDLQILIDHANSRGMITELFTNGWNPLDVYEPDVFWISVDGLNEMHDRMRTKGSFHRLMENVDKLNKRKVISWTTINRDNVDSLEEICAFLSDRVTGMMFNFFYPYCGVDDLSLSKEERVLTGQKLLGLKSGGYRILNSDAFLERLDEDYTVYPWMGLTISSTGHLHHGCPIEQIQESYDCSECYMVCCREPALAYGLNIKSLNVIIDITCSENGLLWFKPCIDD